MEFTIFYICFRVRTQIAGDPRNQDGSGKIPAIDLQLQHCSFARNYVSCAGVKIMTREGMNPESLVRELDELRRKIKELESSEKECREAKDALQLKEEKLRIMGSAVDSAISAIALADLNGKLIYVNDSFLRMWRFDRGEQVIGKPADEFWHLRERAAEVIQVLRDRGNWVGELVAMRNDGSLFNVELSANMVCSEGGKPICMMASFVDITGRKILEHELRAMSLVDELTGLYNRRGFMMLVQQHLKLATRMRKGVFLLFADMDGLKDINDRFGHIEGDRALVEVAEVLKQTFRDSDVVARISGDEFAAVAIDADGIGVGILSNRFQDNLESDNTKKPDRPYKLSVSLGIAYCKPDEPCTVDELLRRADALMYEKKKMSRAGGKKIL